MYKWYSYHKGQLFSIHSFTLQETFFFTFQVKDLTIFDSLDKNDNFISVDLKQSNAFHNFIKVQKKLLQ